MNIKDLRTQELNKVLLMTNTNGLNMVTEMNGKIYRTPFKGEINVSGIEKNDLFMVQDLNDDGSYKISSLSFEDMILPITDPDNHPIYTERSDNSGKSILPLYSGSLDPNTGGVLAYDYKEPYCYSSRFIPVVYNKEYTFTCPTGKISTIRIFLYDSNKKIIKDLWVDGLYNYEIHPLSKSFSTTNDYAKYMRIDCVGVNDTTAELYVDSILDPLTEHVTFSKINYINDYHTCISDIVEANKKQFEIYNATVGADYTIATIKAPINLPLKSSLRLLNTGVNTSQLVDFSLIRDNEDKDTCGRVELAIRSFDKDTPTPDFKIGFADTLTGELVYKFRVDHDAMPISFTKDGMIMTMTNSDTNNPLSDDILNINFREFNTKINNIYDTLHSFGMVDEDGNIDPTKNFLDASGVSFNSNINFDTVDDALNHILLSHASDVSSMNIELDELTDTVLALDMKIIQMGDLDSSQVNSIKNSIDILNKDISNIYQKIETMNNKLTALDNMIVATGRYTSFDDTGLKNNYNG